MLYIPSTPPSIQGADAKTVMDYLQTELQAISRALAENPQTIGGATVTSLTAGTIAYLLHYQFNTVHWIQASGICSRPGVFRNLRCMSTGAPGSGESYTYLWLRDGNATDLVCLTQDSEISSSDLVHSVRFEAGERYCLYIQTSAGAGGQAHAYGVDFEPD